LSVTGQLHNLRDEPATAPALRVSLLDRFGKAVATKVARPIDAAVPAHATRYFAITLVDPPAALHDLQVTFEPSGKAPVAAPPAEAKPAPAAK
ncbi:MAG: FxLYD domain-containing protein, partial [Phenylobacterium sp.]